MADSPTSTQNTSTTAGSGGTTDPTTPPTTDPVTPDPTDPGTTDPGTTAPATPTQPSAPLTDPTTITFTLPKATAHARYERVQERRREWHARALHAVITEVRHQIGKPYVYGADGPRAFDCSGLVRFVFGHAIGRWLPHNAAAQYDVVQHISRRQLEPGDLVFQESGGYPFHVGIYAGHDKWWHAPHSGDHVRRQTIYRGHLYYGRVLTTALAATRTHTRSFRPHSSKPRHHKRR